MAEVTCRCLADRMVELGLTTRQRADAALTVIAGYVPDLDAHLEGADRVDVLMEFGVTVSVHGEDVDDLEESYRDILEQAAACWGDAATVSSVELTRDERGGESLDFRLNGEPRSWPVEHLADDYLDQLAMFENIPDLRPAGDDPRAFHAIPRRDTCDDDVYVLATREQARTLRDEFGLRIDVYGDAEQ